MIAITGATGEVGGRVARRLAQAGREQRLIVRDAARAPQLDGLVQVAQFGGYLDADGMQRACDGIETLLLVSGRECADRVAQHATAIDAAVAAGVQRVVYLSFLSAAPGATFTFARDHYATEEHIRSSAAAFTFSRQSLYMDLVPLIGGEEGVVRGPAGDGRLAPVLRDDVADALVAMLMDPGHDGATYELTGPQAFTLAEMTALVTELSGRAMRFENQTLEEAQASRTGYGAPAWEVAGWISTYTAIAAGEMDVVTDDVARLTGHEPTALHDFLTK